MVVGRIFSLAQCTPHSDYYRLGAQLLVIYRVLNSTSDNIPDFGELWGILSPSRKGLKDDLIACND
jgi:hypothetical protein